MNGNTFLNKPSRTLIGVCALLLLFCGQLPAQSARARMTGTVSDPQGAVVPGATVTVINVATGTESKAITGQDGHYETLDLPIGSYKIKVERDGIKTTETPAYKLEISQVLKVDVKLPLGGRNEIVEVTGEASLVETVNPTLGASVTSATIVDLPLNGRNVLTWRLCNRELHRTTLTTRVPALSTLPGPDLILSLFCWMAASTTIC